MLVFYPLYFFIPTRLDYLDSGLALFLKLFNPYVTFVFANLTVLSTFHYSLPMNFHTKLNDKSVKIRN